MSKQVPKKIKTEVSTKDVKIIEAGATEVRSHFQEIVDSVHYKKQPVIISKHRKPWVIIQPLDEKNEAAEEVIVKKS